MFSKLKCSVRRLVKPAAMLGVVGTLSLTLVITTPANAQAFVPPVPLPVIFGATEMALPELMATSTILGPVGWTIAGVAILGVGLYATRDYWLPYVAGTWGAATTLPPSSPAGSGAWIRPGFTVASITGQNTASVVATESYNQTISGGGFVSSTAAALNCKNTVTNVTTVRQWMGDFANGAIGVAPNTRTIGVVCRLSSVTGSAIANEIITGGLIASPGADAQLAARPTSGTGSSQGPENILRFGDALQVDKAAFDPHSADAKYETTEECVRPDGTKFNAVRQSVGSDLAIKVAACGADSPGAHATGQTTVKGFRPGGDTTGTTIWSATAPAPTTDKPLCGPTRPGPGCKLQVLIDSLPCVVGSWNCQNWLSLSQDPNWTPRISCQYGPYAVPLSTCNPLERGYEPNGAPATTENTDGNPSTRNDADPGGSQQAPPATALVPGSAGSPAPGSTTDQAACFPTGWAMFNPVEWVMKPVGCALQSAFVPNPTLVQTQTAAIQTKFQNVGFQRITDAWMVTFQAAGGGSGCAGPTVQFQMSGVHQSLQPFNACSAPMSTVAGVSYAVSAIGMVLFGGLGIARAIAAGFGFNFSMGKGGDST
jgi:hypothetical protein